MAEARINIVADPGQVIRTARIIVRHLTALADELEAPDMFVRFPEEITEEQVAELRERFKANLGKRDVT